MACRGSSHPPGDGGDEAVWLTRDGPSMSLGVGSNGASPPAPAQQPARLGRRRARPAAPRRAAEPDGEQPKRLRTGSRASPSGQDRAGPGGAAGPLSPARMVSAVQHGSIPPEVIAKARRRSWHLRCSQRSVRAGQAAGDLQPRRGAVALQGGDRRRQALRPAVPTLPRPIAGTTAAASRARATWPNAPLRRRYGAVVQADGSKGFRYHEYTRVHIDEAPRRRCAAHRQRGSIRRALPRHAETH